MPVLPFHLLTLSHLFKEAFFFSLIWGEGKKPEGLGAGVTGGCALPDVDARN